jgi:hypothetical protein
MGSRRWRVLMVVGLWILQVGCRPDQPAIGGEQPDTLPPVGQVAAEMAEPDAESLRREADEIDRIVIELRNHITRMRSAPTPGMRDGMNQHRAQVASLTEIVQRGIPVERTAEGMPADQLALMRDEMETARQEMEELGTAPEADFRRRMAGHLDRLERVAAMLERHAADLRRQ